MKHNTVVILCILAMLATIFNWYDLAQIVALIAIAGACMR